MVGSENAVRGQIPRYRLAFCGLLVFMLGSVASWAAPDADPASDFPTYLAQHQADLTPFFEAHGAILLRDGLQTLISTVGRILLATALFAWVLDVGMGWGYSTVFAPAYAKFPRAVVYACGRLALALLITFVLTFAAMVGLRAGAGLPALIVVIVLAIPAIFIQVLWVGYLYRTRVTPSLLFYLALMAVHGAVAAIVVPTLFTQQVDTAMVAYVNQSVVPALRTEAEKARADADTQATKRDAMQATVSGLKAQVVQDQAREEDLQKQIETRKSGPAALYSQLVLLRATGNLAEAGRGLADFIAKYPNDPHADPARGQLEAVNQALSAQLAEQRREQAEQARAEAAARRELLARADAGTATLSEMRAALLGKTTAQVAALFGQPSETGADKWGYGKPMILDPQTHTKRGLTVVFAEGLVQGVDYYYGAPQ